MDDYTTTILWTVYMPKDVIGSDSGSRTLVHEAVHVRQFQKWGPFFLVTYLTPHPFATLRWYWEREAYEQTAACYHQDYGPKALNEYFREWLVDRFVGSDYLWMYPHRPTVRRWFDNIFAQVKEGSIAPLY